LKEGTKPYRTEGISSQLKKKFVDGKEGKKRFPPVKKGQPE